MTETQGVWITTEPFDSLTVGRVHEDEITALRWSNDHEGEYTKFLPYGESLSELTERRRAAQ